MINQEEYSTQIVGFHTHQGGATTNGPVAIANCGNKGDNLNSPFANLMIVDKSGINVENVNSCSLDDENKTGQNMTGGICVNPAGEGGPCTVFGGENIKNRFVPRLSRTYQKLLHSKPSNAYYNLHTAWSFRITNGLGGPRGQLMSWKDGAEIIETICPNFCSS